MINVANKQLGQLLMKPLVTLDYLLELNGIGRMEKIDALELAGATILFRPKNASHFPKAFEYW